MKSLTRSQRLLLVSALVFAGVVASRFVVPAAQAPQTAQPPAQAIRAERDPSDVRETQRLYGAVDTSGLISRLQARLKDDPENTDAYSQLGWALIQRRRETADAANDVQALQAFEQALKREPEHLDSLIGAATVALSNHDFSRALQLGQQAQRINPFRAQIYGVQTDALVELGRYDEAVAMVQQMVDTRPDLNSYSRVSYVRELYGDIPGAIDAMQRAVNAGNPAHESTLWTRVQLGHLFFNSGDLTRAESEYRTALVTDSRYVHALAGLARVDAARGDMRAAIKGYEDITQRLPLPEFALALGELYEATGDIGKARGQYDLIRAVQKLNQSQAANVDMELALFEAEHGADAQSALKLARAAYASRPSVHAADVLAWALHKTGAHAEALRYSREALKLNTQDAAMRYRAGVIALAAGESADGRRLIGEALKINPHFSPLRAPEAKKLLAQAG
jgi:tetratricopeptide (TPR) repeat protein